MGIGHPAPPKMGAQQPPFFGPFTAVKWLDGWMPLGTEVGLGPGHIVLDGDPATPQKRGHSPQFSAHVCCGQMAG